MKPTSTRDIAQSTPESLDAIQQAIARGAPLFFIQSASGSTLDVHTNEASALKAWDEYIRQVSDGRFNIHLYKREKGVMARYARPAASASSNSKNHQMDAYIKAAA